MTKQLVAAVTLAKRKALPVTRRGNLPWFRRRVAKASAYAVSFAVTIFALEWWFGLGLPDKLTWAVYFSALSGCLVSVAFLVSLKTHLPRGVHSSDATADE